MKPDDCEKGYRGECCCNCKNQHTLHSHPWNKGIGEGPMNEYFAFVCTGFLEIEGDRVIYQDMGKDKKHHGMCELHSRAIEVSTQPKGEE